MNETVTVGKKKYEAMRAKLADLEQQLMTVRRTVIDAFKAGWDWAERVGDAVRERDHLRQQVHRLTLENLALTATTESVPEGQDTLPRIDPETDDTMGKVIPITERRLFDLVRYSRGYLLDERLITMGEWTWLTTGATPDVPGAGSPSRLRLEEYDALRARVQNLADLLRQARRYCTDAATGKDIDTVLSDLKRRS